MLTNIDVGKYVLKYSVFLCMKDDYEDERETNLAAVIVNLHASRSKLVNPLYISVCLLNLLPFLLLRVS